MPTMRKYFFWLLLLLIGSPMHTQTTDLPKKLPINTGWTFRQAHTGTWRLVDIPSSVHTALMRHNLIEDPFYRDNENAVQWIEQEDWEYQTSFLVDNSALRHQHLEMVFKGLDTYAQVFLNDSLILETDNMFRTYQVDVKPFLRVGENHLHVYFESPIGKATPLWDALDYELPGGIRTMTRKAQFHYGWDWGPRLVGAGMLKSPELMMWNDVIIEDVFVTPLFINDQKARVAIRVRYRSDIKGKASFIARFEKSKILEDRFILPGVHEDSMTFDIDNPRLWWCNGLGEPHLYDVRFELKQGLITHDIRDARFGLRQVELVTEPDEKGSTFYFKLNGKPVFAKGANIIPLDMFQDRVTGTHYRDMINNALAANMNMLRVWGGGIYEDDVFYQLCDANGILVWQDFMFACAMYPGDGAFLKNASREAYQQIERLRQHPCIALWCGNNENNEAWHNWGWQMSFSEAQRARLWRDYQTLFQDLLKTYVNNYAGNVPYWESSPMHGRMHPMAMLEGDAHYWGVWHDEEPFEVFNQKVPRFMSEFGFQAFPTWETIEAFSMPQDLKLDSPVMLNHQKHPRGNALIATYMKRNYGLPTNFQHFNYLSQVLQAEGMRIGLEAHRRNKPYCMGSLYWQLNDVWPAASWSGIDYFGRWKALHYAVRHAFHPVAVLPVIQDDSLKIYGVSDLPSDTTVRLKLELMTFNGQIVASESANNIHLGSTAAQMLWNTQVQRWTGGKQNDLLLHCQLLSPDGQPIHRNILYFATPKKQSLPKPKLTIEIQKNDNNYQILVLTDKLARNVYLRSNTEGSWSDNFFDLLPGEQRTIVFKPKKVSATATFEVSSLVDALP
jgi:beta-mannosidase